MGCTVRKLVRLLGKLRAILVGWAVNSSGQLLTLDSLDTRALVKLLLDLSSLKLTCPGGAPQTRSTMKQRTPGF